MPYIKTKVSKFDILKTLKNNLKAFPEIEKGYTLHVLSAGQFNLIDIIENVVNQIGECSIDLAVWTAAESNLKKAELFVKNKKVKNMRWIIDPSFRSRQPRYVAILEQLFSSECIRTIPTHAKFIICYNENYKVVIQTSMNLNQNKRLESFTVTESDELLDFYKTFVDDVFDKVSDSKSFSTQNANQLVELFGEDKSNFDFNPKKSKYSW